MRESKVNMETSKKLTIVQFNYIQLKTCKALYDLIAEEAEKKNLPMNELVVQIVARALKRKDLAGIPRKKMGRPRKIREPQPA